MKDKPKSYKGKLIPEQKMAIQTYRAEMIFPNLYPPVLPNACMPQVKEVIVSTSLST